MSDEGREVLREALDSALAILRQKLRDGRLTAGDLRAIINALAEVGGVSATISDLAEFYGTTDVNVKSVIKRRYIGKPVRRVYYDFLRFSRHVPESWRRRRCNSGESD